LSNALDTRIYTYTGR